MKELMETPECVLSVTHCGCWVCNLTSICALRLLITREAESQEEVPLMLEEAVVR